MSERLELIRNMLSQTEDAVGAKLGLRRWPKAEDIDSFMPNDDIPELMLKAMGDGTTALVLVIGKNAFHGVAGGYITKTKLSIQYNRITDVGMEKFPFVGYQISIGHSGQYTEIFGGVKEQSASAFVSKLREKIDKVSNRGAGSGEGEDSLKKMENLKEMLEKGLINQNEFEKAKKKILGL